jgi:hypothetical protein
MRVFRILGTLLVVAAAYLFIFTDRGLVAVLLMMASLALLKLDERRRDPFR